MNETFLPYSAPSCCPEKELAARSSHALPLPRIEARLAQNGIKLTSNRTLLSSGLYGDMYLLDTTTGPIVERTYGCRPPSADSTPCRYRFRTSSHRQLPSYSTLRLITTDGQVDIVDPLTNEASALSLLSDLPGIPRYYCSVTEGKRGSNLVAYIDGFDLVFLSEYVSHPQQIIKIFAQIRITYLSACERGFFIHDLAGSCIMIDSASLNPYLTDWQNHSRLDPTSPLAQAEIARSLELLEWLEYSLLETAFTPTTEARLGH